MKTPGMKSAVALFLQGTITLLGMGVLFLMLWEPHLEGRNVHATTFEIYFKDPFLAYVYLGSIPFFVALYRAFGLLGDVRRNGAFSSATVDALRGIKRCAMVQLGFVAGGLVIVAWCGDPDDRPAGFMMGLVIGLGTTAVAVVAAKLARKVSQIIVTGGNRGNGDGSESLG